MWWLIRMVINGLGAVIFGQVIILTPPDFDTPQNDCQGIFTVAWGAVVNATGYILQRRVNGGAWTTIYSGPNLEFAQSGLAVGTYEYQVVAVKGNKQSPPVATGTVQVLQQGNIGSPYRVGNLLIQDVRTGCAINGNQIGKYGCTDPAAKNYDPAATISEGCVYPPPPIYCPGDFDYFARLIHASSGTLTAELATPACANGTGSLTGLSIHSVTASEQWAGQTHGGYQWTLNFASQIYTASTIRITFNYTNHDPYWNYEAWYNISWTGFQPD